MDRMDDDFTQAVEDLDRRTDLEARKRLLDGRKASGWAAARRMTGDFWNVYHKQGARREGVPGLFRAVQAGMFQFLSYAKHWELERNERQKR
jgi:hypothetical protein